MRGGGFLAAIVRNNRRCCRKNPIKILVTYDGTTNRTGKIVEVRAAHGERLLSRTQKRSVAAAGLRDIRQRVDRAIGS
jgi:hypothetical protein